MTTSPSMPANVDDQTNKLITFEMLDPCDPLWMDTLYVSIKEPSPAGLGNVNPNGANENETTSHELRVGNARFQSTLTFINNNAEPYGIVLTYDPITYVVSDFEIGLFSASNTVTVTTTEDVVTVEFQGRDGGDSTDDGRDRIVITEASTKRTTTQATP